MLSAEQQSDWERDGYLVVPGLFGPAEVESLREHYMRLRAQGPHPGDMIADTKLGPEDPLSRFPRMIHMHHRDPVSLRWLLDCRIAACLTDLFGREPYGVQTMLYFKPPGARGQALHQDNWYLQARPGTCMAAWLALDPCDEENGCMEVVPGSHRLPILCADKADAQRSFTDVTVPLPEGTPVVPIPMRPGDVLFFHGALIHGSYPNTSRDRFRRSLIGHYVTSDAEVLTLGCRPVLRMDGTEVALAPSEGGGPCGIWTDLDRRPAVEMIDPPRRDAGGRGLRRAFKEENH